MEPRLSACSIDPHGRRAGGSASNEADFLRTPSPCWKRRAAAGGTVPNSLRIGPNGGPVSQPGALGERANEGNLVMRFPSRSEDARRESIEERRGLRPFNRAGRAAMPPTSVLARSPRDSCGTCNNSLHCGGGDHQVGSCRHRETALPRRRTGDLGIGSKRGTDRRGRNLMPRTRSAPAISAAAAIPSTRRGTRNADRNVSGGPAVRARHS